MELERRDGFNLTGNDGLCQRFLRGEHRFIGLSASVKNRNATPNRDSAHSTDAGRHENLSNDASGLLRVRALDSWGHICVRLFYSSVKTPDPFDSSHSSVIVMCPFEV